MGTKQQTQESNQFAPSGMQAYNQMTPAFSGAATGYMQNPFGNPFFQQQQQLGTRQAENIGGTQMSNIGTNIRNSGIGEGGASPFQTEMMANQGRANSGLQSQLGFLNPVSNALQMQQGSMGMAAGYSPLKTGQNTTQSTSGLGTWLPQLISGAMGAFNPVASLMGGGMGSGGGAGAGANFMGGGAFGAPSPGYGGSGFPGQSFMGGGSPFFSGGPMMGGGMPPRPGGPQMGNSQYGYGQ